MTDISKCSGEGCPDKMICLRYTAPDGYIQSYIATQWSEQDWEGCPNMLMSKSVEKRVKAQKGER